MTRRSAGRVDPEPPEVSPASGAPREHYAVEVTASGRDHSPYAACTHEHRYRVVRVRMFGLAAEPVGPAWRTPREAIDFADRLETSPASGLVPVATLAGAERPTADEPPIIDGRRAQPNNCIACGEPLPGGSRRQRRTCSLACRLRLSRGGGAEKRPADEYAGAAVLSETVSPRPAASAAGRQETLALI